MKKTQKCLQNGSAAIVITAVIALLIGVGITYVVLNKNSSMGSSVTDQYNNNQQANQNNTDSTGNGGNASNETPSDNPYPGATAYVDSKHGFTFYYPENWILTGQDRTTGSISGDINFNHIGPGKDDSIIIHIIEGSKVGTTDAKFGTVNYFYDTNLKSWMT